MRIVHVANAYGPTSGGLRTAMHELARGYRERGHDITLIVAGPEHRDEQTPFGRRLMVAAPELPGSGGYRFITDINTVIAHLHQLAPERLEVSDRTTLRNLGWWAKANDIPNVMWAHERVDGVLKAWAPISPTRAIADVHNRGTAERFDRIVCTTGFAEEEFARIGVVNTVRVPLGVDLDFFRPDRRDENLREKLLQGDDVLIAMCSRLSKEKKPEIAISALAELRAAGVRARLVIAGAGPREAALRRMSWGLPIEFLGFLSSRDEVAALQSSADLVFAPGPIETFGLAALEALAGGTSVVASNTSALREIVIDGSGAAVEPSGEHFAQAVQDLLTVPLSERRRAARGRAEQFPWSTSIDSVLALHNDPVTGVPVPQKYRKRYAAR